MFKHPLWLVGFRPFFTLAFLSGAVLPLLWALVYSGKVTLPATLSPLQWHAHEMLFGFGWAVLGGFLLTASKNWVSIRGMHGGPLAIAVLLWMIARGAVLMEAGLVRELLLNAFLVYVIAYLVWTLVRYRKQDCFPDNGFFVVGLPVFIVAEHLLLRPETYVVGFGLSIGIFRLAFAVMFERTITQFMKAGMKLELPRWPWLDYPIKALVLVSAFEALLPAKIAAVVLGVAGVLLFARWIAWKPLRGLSTFGIGVMYVGYLGLVLHFFASALKYSGLYVGIGSLPVHVFTLLTMGIVIPSMLIRICQGHTGRKLQFTVSDRIAIGCMGVAAFFRLVATQVWPAGYMRWIEIAAVGWSLCFVIIGVRLVPFLWKPRVDGREH